MPWNRPATFVEQPQEGLARALDVTGIGGQPVDLHDSSAWRISPVSAYPRRASWQVSRDVASVEACFCTLLWSFQNKASALLGKDVEKWVGHKPKKRTVQSMV